MARHRLRSRRRGSSWLIYGLLTTYPFRNGEANLQQIHASTVNRDKKDVIRLATDLRFVDSSHPWDQVGWNLIQVSRQCMLIQRSLSDGRISSSLGTVFKAQHQQMTNGLVTGELRMI